MSDYWDRVRKRAKTLGSDGCTGVKDYYLDACLEHDGHYTTHEWVGYLTWEDAGEKEPLTYSIPPRPISRGEADTRFRQVIQTMSRFGRFSPMSWWRYAGVRIGGRWSWDN